MTPFGIVMSSHRIITSYFLYIDHVVIYVRFTEWIRLFSMFKSYVRLSYGLATRNSKNPRNIIVTSDTLLRYYYHVVPLCSYIDGKSSGRVSIHVDVNDSYPRVVSGSRVTPPAIFRRSIFVFVFSAQVRSSSPVVTPWKCLIEYFVRKQLKHKTHDVLATRTINKRIRDSLESLRNLILTRTTFRV